MRPLVIIHGWSDDSSSFEKLSDDLRASQIADSITTIDLGDFESLNDTVSLDDVVVALERAWARHRLPTDRRSVDVIVHSTGALVVRSWLTKNYKPSTAPVFHFVMLAPANFGSPLAHKGDSFIGRVLKGWNARHPGEVGAQILDGLELGSSFTWELACKDCVPIDNHYFYSSDGILATVLVGNAGYDGIRSIANEVGTDGTVRVATANLNCIHLDVSFVDATDAKAIPMRVLNTVAFRVLGDENHGSIVRGAGSGNPETFQLICEALTVAPDNFAAFTSNLAERNKSDWLTTPSKRRYQHAFNNVVMRLRDDRGQFVRNYLIEFFVTGDTDESPKPLTRTFNEEVIESVHCYDKNKSYRAFHLDISELLLHATSTESDELRFSLSAEPAFRDDYSAGYKSWKTGDMFDARIPIRPTTPLFQPFQTVLVDLTIPRAVGKNVFRLRQR